MDNPVQVDVTAQGTVRVVLTGSVILVRHDEVLTPVERAMKAADPNTRMFVDLSDVTSLDSSGIALLLLLRRRALRAGAEFHLYGARPEVRHHLRLAGLTTLFRLDTAEADNTPSADGKAPRMKADSRATTEVEILDEPFDMDEIRTVRHRLGSYAASVGMSDMDQYKLMLAVTEVMANSVRHGGGQGHIRVRGRGDRLMIEISDEGPGIPRRFLEERPRPRPGRIGLAGLWLVRQICDGVEIDTGPGGTTVRLTFSFPG
ncbi:ATP-binding protein [Actinoplanes sp. NPDC024001]|uniref:ATP-binding protein n=1 Tax=Actinoplanes sp. NPDC024001 TaxID=3154598 RepID=UPI0033F46F9D